MKRKIVLLLFAAIFTLSVSAQTESPAATGETAADGKPDPVPEEKTEVIAPVEIDETLSVEPQEEFLFSEFQKQEKETVESLQKALAANTKSFTMYKAFQYTSVTVAGIGVLLVILDAFIDTGSEYPFTPSPSDNNPDPSPVTTAFGNLSIAGAVVAVVGTGASIGFQFPYRKYRNQQYILEEKIRNLQEWEETQTGLEDLIKEVIVD